MCEIGDDREAKPRARLALIEPLPPLHRPFALLLGQSWTVIVDDDEKSLVFYRHPRGRFHLRVRPFAGIVEQVADHLLEILPLPLELQARSRFDFERKSPFLVDA